MSRADVGEGVAGRYHHGHLRRTLLDAALELASERGLGGFSMREVARRAGVSHNAPYHHFADKGTIVAELAAESFDALTGVLREARAGASGDAAEKLLASGVAYVRFAVENPERFRLMFRPELRTGYRPELGDSSNMAVIGDSPEERSPALLAASTAYGELVDAVSECQESGLVASGDPAPLALTAWSTVHGLAVLVLDGPEGGIASSVEEANQAARVVTETLARGLLTR